MSKISPIIKILCALLLFSSESLCQKTTPQLRCGTMERLDILFNSSPPLKAQYEANILMGEKQKNDLLKKGDHLSENQGSYDIYRLSSVVYVPVVVHVVLPNADQVSDLDIYNQIEKLNTDFAGLNADSANIPAAFKPFFAKSKIQFKLARRDPSGNLSSGIERRNSSTGSNINLTTDPIKRFSSGGLDAWDYNMYLNLWIGLDASGQGILGYATFPGTDIPANQGVFINSVSWGNNSCYVNANFNLGRTLVHELGHYFGLYHIWGDDGGACTGDDFRQLPGTCLVPGTNLLGDTPNQAGATSGCPSGIRTDACSASTPGFMYQNYMDYTNDACYAMFTDKQVDRMEWVIENCRAGYIASPLLNPPAGALLRDLQPVSVVNPGGFEISGCNVINYPALNCAATVQPKVRIKNNGVDTIRNFIAGLIINGTAQPEQTVITSMPLGETRVITFPNYSFANGTHVLKFYTKTPNSSIDQQINNDTLTVTFTVGTAVTGPLNESFENSNFPPVGWRLINPNSGSFTWQRTTRSAKTGAASAFMEFYNYTTRGHLDYLISPLIDVAGADSILVSFDRAYRPYSVTSTTFVDTLLLQTSVDCGSSFPITAWKKGGTQLATNPLATTANYTPVTSDWKNEVVDVRPYTGTADKINLAFVAKNGYGQNLYLDDINIRVVRLLRRDALVTKIIDPFLRICSRNFTPSVEITNKGLDTLKTVKVNYTINGSAPVTITYTGALATNQSVNVVFPSTSVTSGGLSNFIFYTSDPNGSFDQVTNNDTIKSSTIIFDPLDAPIREGFEQATFPPANWALVSGASNYTWQRNTLSSSDGVASAWIRNKRITVAGAIDELYSPVIKLTNPDSVFVSFTQAHVTSKYPGSTAIKLDTLEVLLTKDCGKTFTSVFKKWGEDLQSVNEPNFPYLYPASDTIGFIPNNISQWRKQTINLTNTLSGSLGNFQLVFRNTANNGNNTFIDNININTVTLPLKLKQQGFIISPNPNTGWIYIQHYLPPLQLKGIQVINSNGQIIWERVYNGNALSLIPIDIMKYATGIYTVRMVYSNKVITQRIIKVE